MPERTHSIELELVGMNFRTKKEVRQHLKSQLSFAVKIEREADNEHDENAIKVLKGSFHLGYIKRETAAILAPRLDSGSLRFKSGLCTEIDVDRGTAVCILRLVDAKVRSKKVLHS